MVAFDGVLEIAVDHHGYVTTADAARAGIDPTQLRKMAAAGRLEHVAHGVYRVPSLGGSLHGGYAEAIAWSRGRGVISHESALDLFDLCDVNPPRIHLTVPRTYAPRRRGGDLYRVWRRDLPGEDVTQREGIRVVRPRAVIAECTSYGTNPRLLFQAVERAHQGGHLTDEERLVLEAKIEARETGTRHR